MRGVSNLFCEQLPQRKKVKGKGQRHEQSWKQRNRKLRDYRVGRFLHENTDWTWSGKDGDGNDVDKQSKAHDIPRNKHTSGEFLLRGEPCDERSRDTCEDVEVTSFKSHLDGKQVVDK